MNWLCKVFFEFCTCIMRVVRYVCRLCMACVGCVWVYHVCALCARYVGAGASAPYMHYVSVGVLMAGFGCEGYCVGIKMGTI